MTGPPRYMFEWPAWWRRAFGAVLIGMGFAIVVGPNSKPMMTVAGVVALCFGLVLAGARERWTVSSDGVLLRRAGLFGLFWSGRHDVVTILLEHHVSRDRLVGARTARRTYVVRALGPNDTQVDVLSTPTPAVARGLARSLARALDVPFFDPDGSSSPIAITPDERRRGRVGRDLSERTTRITVDRVKTVDTATRRWLLFALGPIAITLLSLAAKMPVDDALFNLGLGVAGALLFAPVVAFLVLTWLRGWTRWTIEVLHDPPGAARVTVIRTRMMERRWQFGADEVDGVELGYDPSMNPDGPSRCLLFFTRRHTFAVGTGMEANELAFAHAAMLDALRGDGTIR